MIYLKVTSYFLNYLVYAVLIALVSLKIWFGICLIVDNYEYQHDELNISYETKPDTSKKY